VDQVFLDNTHQRPVDPPATHHGRETAARTRAAVSLYVAVVCAAAVVGLAAADHGRSALSPALVALIALAAVADLREVRLPGVGVITLSFVIVLAALIIFGLFPALLVATASGAATAWLTRDVQKILFNIGNHVLSTFFAGALYVSLAPSGTAFAGRVLPAYAATAVDFLAATVVLAGVVGLATGESSLRVWQRNYQWGLPSYLTGASLSLLIAWLYLRLGLPGLLFALPPLYLIYYSYEVYVERAREREDHTRDVASFKEELAASAALHAQLFETQRKVAAELERARRIQLDLLPKEAPAGDGLAIAHRIAMMEEMGGDYFDFIPLTDERLAIVCGDVMGKGLAAALIMTMARSLIHSAAETCAGPAELLATVNDALARDLAGQQSPSFLTLSFALYDRRYRRLTVAGGGHTPTLVFTANGERRLAAQGPALGVRPGLTYGEHSLDLEVGDLIALYTDGVTETRRGDGEQYGCERLCRLLGSLRDHEPAEALAAVWRDLEAFRAGNPPGDDVTLLLARVS